MFTCFTIIYLICVLGTYAKPPNIVFILTDDQDTMLGGLKPMEQTRKLIGDSGVTFSNVFATTPICCPSRSSILTGSYLHNHKTMNNSLSGGCSSVSWQKHYERKTFATYLQNVGYTTMFAGKYLNMYGHKGSKGVQHIPPGWDWWIGLVGNSKYYNYTLSVNGTAVHHGDSYENDYLTDIIKHYSIEFLKQKVAHDSPFMMMLSTPASHAPFTPAPQYKGRYNTTQTPRSPNFNIASKDKHWLLRIPPATLSKATLDILDNIYQSRLETLLSVDDLVADVVYNLDSMGVLENTYIFFTSDHGFHIGQFGLPWDKRQPYEFDLRIPLLVRGPLLPKNKTLAVPILSIDFAPTFLSIAGLSIPNTMDGKSFLPSLSSKYSSSIKQTNAESRTFLVEYYGEGDWKSISPSCPFKGETFLAECTTEAECKCQDAVNNTYHCMRHLSQDCNFIYCKFLDSENFIEVYDLQTDPFQLENIVSVTKNTTKKKCEKIIKKLGQCQGVSCLKYDGHNHMCILSDTY